MSFVTYQEIESLIDHAEADGGRMRCYFKCPSSGMVIEGFGNMPRSVSGRVRQDAANSLMRQLFQMLSNFIRQTTGLYFNFGSSATSAGGAAQVFTQAEKEAGVVDAFEKLAVYPGKPQQQKRFNHVDGRWTFVE